MLHTWIDAELLAELESAAARAPRRRSNRNFHERLDEACQRLLVAIQPDSYIAPHRHLAAEKAETLLCLRGRLGVVLFDAAGTVSATRVLRPDGDCLGVHILPTQFHSFIALEAQTLFFEAKSGPYRPVSEAERAPWAPREGEPAVAGYLASLRALF